MAIASAITIAASSHQTHAGTPWDSPAVLSAATVVLGTEGWATAVVSDAVGDGVCDAWLVVSAGVGVGSVGVAVGSVGLEVCVGSVGVGARVVVVVVGSDVGSAVSDVVLVGRATVGGVTAGPVTVGSVTVGVAVGAVTVGDTLAVRDGLSVGRFTSPPPPHAVSRMAAPTVRAATLADGSSFIRRSLLGRAVNPRLAAA
ncbi:MAG TPA: hypothetical protein VFG98_05415 [Intrasporangium sp.]|nr:hypothetical protein [Intrasporangium sp.]